MDTEVKTFVEEIQLNTGVDFCVFKDNGESLYGERETVPTGFNGVFSDVGLKRTLFRFKYKNAKYIGKISGSGKAERNYAYLISELAEKGFTSAVLNTKEDFYRSVLFGEANYVQTEKAKRKFKVADKISCVIVVSGKKKQINEIYNVVVNYATGEQDFAFILDSEHCILIKYSDEDSGEYGSFTEYADFLFQTLLEETGASPLISIGGTVKRADELNSSFEQAMDTERTSRVLNELNGVHSFKDFLFFKMIEELPKHKLNEFLQLLVDETSKDVFSDDEMIATTEAFFENNLNISETSRKMYLHRNTLNYRLDKIERCTGLNVRKFSDAVTFRMITILAKLVK